MEYCNLLVGYMILTNQHILICFLTANPVKCPLVTTTTTESHIMIRQITRETRDAVTSCQDT